MIELEIMAVVYPKTRTLVQSQIFRRRVPSIHSALGRRAVVARVGGRRRDRRAWSRLWRVCTWLFEAPRGD